MAAPAILWILAKILGPGVTIIMAFLMAFTVIVPILLFVAQLFGLTEAVFGFLGNKITMSIILAFVLLVIAHKQGIKVFK